VAEHENAALLVDEDDRPIALLIFDTDDEVSTEVDESPQRKQSNRRGPLRPGDRVGLPPSPRRARD
jgi:hypothetical protein